MLQPRGRLDAESCSGLRHQLGVAFAVGVRAVVVDLRDVSAIDPVGLGVLTGAQRHLRSKGGALVITHASPAVVTTLRIHDCVDLLDVPAPTSVRGLRTGPGEPRPATPRATSHLRAVPDPPGIALPR